MFDPTDPLSSRYLMAIQFKELAKATKNFAPEMLLGKGELGCVFEGWIDEHSLTAVNPGSGIPVVVKVWNVQGWQKDTALWLKEFEFVRQLHHPNLVRLIGFCFEYERVLVYEFMCRGSLEDHLVRGKHLPWETRIKVAIGAARGLSFLHNLAVPITYRCFKARHILLDNEYNAKLSGFGFANDAPIGKMPSGSIHNMRPLGFAAPEYIPGLQTRKCDVFRFGVVLLELLSGIQFGELSKQNQTELYPYREHIVLRIIKTTFDRLDGRFPKKEASKVAKLAFQCLSSSPKERPTMAEVIVALEQLQCSK